MNGSNHEINQKILFLFCSVKGSKNKILDYLENFIAHGGGGLKNLTQIDRGKGSKTAKKNADVTN